MLTQTSKIFFITLASIAIFCASSFAKLKVITVNDAKYISIRSLASEWRMKYSSTKKPKLSVNIENNLAKLQFKIHDRFFTLNGTKVFLGNPIVEKKGILYISKRDYRHSISPIVEPHSFVPIPVKLYHIVIDPGHGGKDEGAVNKTLNVKEKDLTLKIALELESELKKHGYKVTLTRRKDVTMSLENRTSLANKANADLFISIHINAAATKEATGIETFVFTNPHQPSTGRSTLTPSDKVTQPANSFNTWSTLVGYYVQSSLSKIPSIKDRGLRRARFGVLKGLKCPGILVETGFISNIEEGRSLTKNTHQKRIASNIFEGVFTYQKTINKLRKGNSA